MSTHIVRVTGLVRGITAKAMICVALHHTESKALARFLGADLLFGHFVEEVWCVGIAVRGQPPQLVDVIAFRGELDEFICRVLVPSV